MEKNLLLAVTLSVGVYAIWFGFVEKRLAPARPAATAPAAISAGPKDTATTPSGKERAFRDTAAIEAQAEAVALGKAQARIHPLGAALVSYRYEEPLGTVELVEDPRPGLLSTWPDLRFKRTGAGVFQAVRPDGVTIVKEFIPEGENRLPRLRLTLSNPTRQARESGAWTLGLGPGLGTVASEMPENRKVWRALALKEAEGSRGKIEILKPGNYQGPYRWVGIDNRYFLAALVPDFKDFDLIESRWPPHVLLTAKSQPLPPGRSRSWDIPYYLGAKGHTWLSRYGAGLERSIDFGFFAQLGRFVLQVLNFLHARIGNWGWSIIVLTALLQAALFPLTYKSLKAMSAMRRLQPEIARLQQKYGKEPQRLNAEMLELYKKHGANPLGGCLPMLLQMPVFIALYNALRNAWELHGAPWIFWIKDLSAKDPYYILPLLMGGLMFLQNKLNPPSTDPSQAAMMTWMPVIFTFMFLRFPAGLVLYWMTNSLLSATQQLLLKNRFNSK